MNTEYDKIILSTYKHIGNFANFFAGGSAYVDDLIQETIIVVLEMDKERVIEKHHEKRLKGYVYGIMFRSFNSVTSPFYTKIKKFNYLAIAEGLEEAALGMMDRPDFIDDWTPYKCLETYNTICTFLTKEGTAEDLSLFKSLISEGTSVGVHKEIIEINPNVSYHTINKRIRNMKKKIQDGNL